MYVSEDDYAVLEDNSGRVRIKTNENFNPKDFITGSILGLLGQADANGFFTVTDYCYPEIPFSAPIPNSINLELAHRDLLELQALKSKSREFVLFISGLEFGVP